MSKMLMFRRYQIATSSSKIKACSLPNTKHRYLFFRNQKLNSSNIKFKAHKNYIHIMAKAGNSDDESQAPIPARHHTSEWKQWVAGILLSMFIPSYTPKIGTLANLKNNMGTVVVTVVTLAEMVESTTGVVGKLSGLAKKRLPNDCNLKKEAESIEDLPTLAKEKAEQTQELIHRVERVGLSKM